MAGLTPRRSTERAMGARSYEASDEFSYRVESVVASLKKLAVLWFTSRHVTAKIIGRSARARRASIAARLVADRLLPPIATQKAARGHYT